MLFAYPYLGVLSYILFEYASLSQMFPALRVLELGKIVVIATLVAWAIRKAVRGNLQIVSDSMNWWFVSFVLAALIAMIFSVEQKLALQGTLDVIKWFGIYVMIIHVIDTLPKWRSCIWLYLILAFRMSQFQIRSFAHGIAHAESTAYFIREGVGAGSTAFFGNAGDFGVLMCVVIPLAFYMMKTCKSKILKAFLLLFLLFFAISIIRSGARGSVVGLLSICLVFWSRSKHKLLIGVSIISVVALYWITAPSVVRARFISATSEENRDATATHRLTLWSAGLRMFQSHPLTGVGVNNFNRQFLDNYATDEQKKGATAPHNIFVECMAELGLVGIVSLLTMIGLVFIRNKQTRAILREHHRKNDWVTNFSYALDLSMVGYLVSGSFLSVLYYPHLYLLLALTVSLHHISKTRIEAGFDCPLETRAAESSAIPR
jgi:probable O-glycosylation ligase (exosortase A-associated)